MDYELIKPDETHDGGAFMSYARTRATAKQERDPDVGDWVHLWFEGGCRAALVTETEDLFMATLSFVMPRETSWRPIEGVPHEEIKGEAISWHWPCGGH